MRISDWSSDVCSSDLLVAFEREHRLRRFPADLGGRAEVFGAPPGLAEADINAGIEAMVTLADGRLLAFCEGQQDDGSSAVFLREESGDWPGGWQHLTLRPGGLFRTTGAALLPSGDVLLLERRYTLLGGLGARLSRIDADGIRPGARLETETLAEPAPPPNPDNLEGVAVHRPAAGAHRPPLLSDDHLNPHPRPPPMPSQ